ncbi:MAG TPA: oligosaccharide flippase family protein [Terriglobia bacterium]|nr:oligosaccharide flippase family protein [Terriglobia bacterium]
MHLSVSAAKNVASSWMRLAVQLAIGFILSPFILHKLGDTAFGVWVLIFSLSAYYGLFDFGILAAVPRYVARFAAANDREALARFVNTSLAACGVLGLLLLSITLVGSRYLDVVFKIPPDFVGSARLLLLILGSDIALGLPLHVLGCVLEGYQRFDLLNLTHIGASILRGLLIFAALTLGGGLVMMALLAVAVNLLRHLVCVRVVFRNTPLRIGTRYVDRSMLGELMSFSLVSLGLTIAENLRFQSDAIVIGAFLSSTAITYYSIGLRLADYPAGIVSSLAQIFTPMASHLEAIGDNARLQRVFLVGNRACALVIFPLCAFLIILGKEIIAVWVGPKYSASYPVLLVLVVSKTLFLAQSCSSRMLVGLGRLRALTLVVFLDGVANLILSIVLIRHWGILGVAIGTAIPLTCTSLFFLPLYLCRILKVSLGAFLRQSFLLPLASTVAMACVLVLTSRLLQPASYPGLFLQLAVAGSSYGLSLLAYFLISEPDRARIKLQVGRLLHQAVGSAQQ